MAPTLRVHLSNPEIALAAAVILAALATARRESKWPGLWERPLSRLARHKTSAILLASLCPLAVRLLLLPWFPMPQPRVHDEFSFLLAADTFAHGRLVNPQHPFWAHFESFHILVRPVYASAFPAAPALLMAAGQVLTGLPWVGVWLSCGMMCGAICWMLQGWIPPRWALLGTLLVALRLGISSYWMNSYWGGALAATAGALVLGALPRLTRAPKTRDALLLAIGLAGLANSRPFEGAVFGLVVAVPLFAGLRRLDSRIVWRRFFLPAGAAMVLAGVIMGHYFARVTGSPWVLPYVLDRNMQAVAPHFVWMRLSAAPAYDDRVLQDFYTRWEAMNYIEARSPAIPALFHRIETYWRFYAGSLLTIPLIAALFAARSRRMRGLLAMTAAFVVVGLAGQVWHNVHYAAPATGLLVLVIVEGMRRLQFWRYRGRPVGRALVWWVPWGCAAMLILQVAVGPQPDDGRIVAGWRWPPLVGLARARILRELEVTGDRHLVFVRYSDHHDSGNEWVYNKADIDKSPVVWARELDRPGNEALMHYYGGRRVWLVEPDDSIPRLISYAQAPKRLMPFVQLGAPGIASIRFPQEVRRKILETSGGDPVSLRSCATWNGFFTEATEIAAPKVEDGCGGAGLTQVSFENWFDWLARQH